MKTIWKFPLIITDRQCVEAPEGALPLAVQLQGGTLTLWMEVDQHAPLVDHYFYVVGTGNPLPPKAMLFVGTVQMLPQVWHIFEELEEEPDEWPVDDIDLYSWSGMGQFLLLMAVFAGIVGGLVEIGDRLGGRKRR